MIEFQRVATEETSDEELVGISSTSIEALEGESITVVRTKRPLLRVLLPVAALAAVALIVGLDLSHNSQQDEMPKISPPDESFTAPEILQQDLPFLVYGTAWKEERTPVYVDAAVRNGFRFIDTANQPAHYNEAGVGEGWTKAASLLGLTRDQLYIQTKFSPHQNLEDNPPFNVLASIEQQVLQSAGSSLEHLHTDYLDAYLLHSPFKTMEDTLQAWRAMESLADKGTAKRLGISNCYSVDTLAQLYHAATVKPVILQNHFRVRDFEPGLLAFTRNHNISFQGFWTLTSNGNLLRKEEVAQMAKDGGLSPQEYMYAFLLAIGITPLDGTKRHQIEDAKLMRDLQMKSVFESEEQIQRMADALGLKLP